MTIARAVQGSFIEGMERPVGPIPPSVFRGSNADLIAVIAPLYLTGSVLDMTYGEGKWWERFQPAELIGHDLKTDGIDFRHLPETDSSVDAVCFDPPYVLSGGKSSAAIADIDFQNRYGIGNLNGQSGWPGLTALVADGLNEATRVARCFILVKCMEFVYDRFRDLPTFVTNHLAERGWAKHDQIVHHTGSGPGGHNIFDIKRARRHHSYLMVFAPDPRAT